MEPCYWSRGVEVAGGSSTQSGASGARRTLSTGRPGPMHGITPSPLIVFPVILAGIAVSGGRVSTSNHPPG